MGVLRRAQSGDRRALELFFREQLPMLKRWAETRVPRWLEREADADDFVQRTALKTLQRLHHLSPTREADVPAYLRRILLNLVRDDIRKAGRRPDHVTLHEEDAIWKSSPLDSAIGNDAWLQFERALDTLTPRDRRAIVGRFRGLSYQQLQRVLQTQSPDAARVAVSRAVTRLAAAMDAVKPARRSRKRPRRPKK